VRVLVCSASTAAWTDEANTTANHAPVGPEVTHDGQLHGGLAAAGFPAQPEAFSLLQAQGDIDYCRYLSLQCGVGDVQVFDAQDRSMHEITTLRKKPEASTQRMGEAL
jgi:hypothetical protein